MQEILLIIEIIVLIIIFYEDTKYRAVSWIAFLILAIAGFVLSLYSTGLFNTVFNSLVNSSIVLIQIGLVYLFYYIKTGKLISIINSKLGLGDVLMFFALSISFSPPAFLIFIFLSFVVSLFVSLSRGNGQSVPLAGYQALFYMIFIILNYFVIELNQFQFELYNF